MVAATTVAGTAMLTAAGRDAAEFAPAESATHSVGPRRVVFRLDPRKEAELFALFATLTVAQSRAYYARLWSPNSPDPVAAKLAQLGSDSKQRLISFLGRHRAYR